MCAHRQNETQPRQEQNQRGHSTKGKASTNAAIGTLGNLMLVSFSARLKAIRLMGISLN